MDHDEYKHVPTPDGVQLAPCPVCGAAAELWRHSEAADAPTATAVMCSNGKPFGPQAAVLANGCLLYLPPAEFYHGTIREAAAYWNRYAGALVALRALRAEQA